jgi:hypothetical protein
MKVIENHLALRHMMLERDAHWDWAKNFTLEKA